MLRRTPLMGCLAFTALGAARAGDPCGPSWGGGWGGYWPGYSIYSTESIPYFSQHPPVYYSYPVPRTYGYSPYAYPPGIMTPDIAPADLGPQTIVNPFVPSLPEPKPTEAERTAKRVQVMINPFVVDEPTLASN